MIGLIIAFIPGAIAAVSTPDRLGGGGVRSEIYNLEKVRVRKKISKVGGVARCKIVER